MDVTYKIDGIDFKTYGVFVSDSDGIMNRPKVKAPASVSWDNYHGDAVDLKRKFYETREITLSCFIKATDKNDFTTKVFTFEQVFDKPGTNRLVIEANPDKPLIYEVYCKDEIAILKKWSDTEMIGTFKLKLCEPEPVKRVLKFTADGLQFSVNITFTTDKLVNIYWGDGDADFDLVGENVSATHDYSNGVYYPVITGCIDEITAFTTNATIIWNKL